MADEYRDLILSQLVELRLDQIRFRYVMSDLARRNLDFWRSHPRLQPFIEQGFVAFALFDAESGDGTIVLENHAVLERALERNPDCQDSRRVLEKLSRTRISEPNNQLNLHGLLDRQ